MNFRAVMVCAAFAAIGCGSVTAAGVDAGGEDVNPKMDAVSSDSSAGGIAGGSAGAGGAGGGRDAGAEAAPVNCYDVVCGDGTTHRAHDSTCAEGALGNICEMCTVPGPACTTVANGSSGGRARFLVHDCADPACL